MSARGLVWSLQVALLVLLAMLLTPSGLTGSPSEAAPSPPQAEATVQRGAGRAGQSPQVLGDINNDGIVDVRDYGIWRQQFGQTGPTLTPTPTALPGRAYVANQNSNNVTVIDTTTNAVVGTTISLAMGSGPIAVGIGP